MVWPQAARGCRRRQRGARKPRRRECVQDRARIPEERRYSERRENCIGFRRDCFRYALSVENVALDYRRAVSEFAQLLRRTRQRANAMTRVDRLLNEVHPCATGCAEYCQIHGVYNTLRRE
jgi:hypothetical protein